MSQVSLTVEEFINLYQEIINYDPTSQCAIDVINKARILAYPLGDWVGTLDIVGLPMCNGCFILPVEYESIREARICNEQIDFDNDRVQFSEERFMCCPKPAVTKQYSTSYLPFLLEEETRLCFQPVNKNDNGKMISIIYLDPQGTERYDTIILDNLIPVETNNKVSKIKLLSKEKTKGEVFVRSGCKSGRLPGNVKYPKFSVYQVDGGKCCDCHCIICKVKKSYRPYTLDDLNEFIDINPEALVNFISAIKTRDSQPENWIQRYQGAINLGRAFLREEQFDDRKTDTGIHGVVFNSITDELSGIGEDVYRSGTGTFGSCCS